MTERERQLEAALNSVRAFAESHTHQGTRIDPDVAWEHDMALTAIVRMIEEAVHTLSPERGGMAKPDPEGQCWSCATYVPEHCRDGHTHPGAGRLDNVPRRCQHWEPEKQEPPAPTPELKCYGYPNSEPPERKVYKLEWSDGHPGFDDGRCYAGPTQIEWNGFKFEGVHYIRLGFLFPGDDEKPYDCRSHWAKWNGHVILADRIVFVKVPQQEAE